MVDPTTGVVIAVLALFALVLAAMLLLVTAPSSHHDMTEDYGHDG